MAHIWLRHEYKTNEQRALITPEQVGVLVKDGHEVTVESSMSRVFKDSEYKKQGAQIALPGTWHNAPRHAFILGIKEELQEKIHADNLALQHRHIYFAHVFKGQKHTPETLRRFTLGQGTLLDLEYLVDESGKRVAAFSYSAGYAGAVAAVYVWAEKQLGKQPPYTLPSNYLSRNEFIDELKAKLEEIGSYPTALVIGAKGRSGQGSVDFFNALGIKATKWGRNETKDGGPFPEILNYDIMCNCVFLAEPVEPFLTEKLVASHRDVSRLSVVADVSNDLSYNPIFGISKSTKFSDATIRVANVDVIEIENLPALTPLDSSIEYANQLFPHLIELVNDKMPRNPVWERAALTYFEHHDIPHLAQECGRDLAGTYLAQPLNFGVKDIQDYISQIFAKNPLSRTDRLYFVDYLSLGAQEVISNEQQQIFADFLAKSELDEIYNSPKMSKHHNLLKAVYGFSRSLSFESVKSADARDDFFDMCEALADIIDEKVGAEERFEVCRFTLHKKLGQKADNPSIKKYLGAVESSITSILQVA